jgi:hypothetical protein
MRARGETARMVVWSAGDMAAHRLRAAALNAALVQKDAGVAFALLVEVSRA